MAEIRNIFHTAQEHKLQCPVMLAHEPHAWDVIYSDSGMEATYFCKGVKLENSELAS